jgi:hypothetical protein
LVGGTLLRENTFYREGSLNACIQGKKVLTVNL